MPTYALTYHLKGSDQKPQETIEADSPEHAGELVAKKFETPGAIVCPHDNEVTVVPKESVAICQIRATQQRRTASARRVTPFDEDEDETMALENPVV
ncbi:MAG: hypothetical protein H7Y38_11000 [Armatimonadetes bacterium]|nr:hypothetical protein [Armatimonadota bacterium]